MLRLLVFFGSPGPLWSLRAAGAKGRGHAKQLGKALCLNGSDRHLSYEGDGGSVRTNFEFDWPHWDLRNVFSAVNVNTGVVSCYFGEGVR